MKTKNIFALMLVFVLIAGSVSVIAKNENAGQSAGNQNVQTNNTVSTQGQGQEQQQQQNEDENQSGNGDNQGNPVNVEQNQQTQNQGEETNLTTQEQQKQQEGQVKQEMKGNLTQLKERLKEMKEEMKGSLQNLNQVEQSVYQNQNRVRIAVHTLLALENFTGGIGRNISQIAREFNNSIQATIRAEERIISRDSISRLLFGGDDNSAGELEGNVIENQNRIHQLNQLMNQCSTDCDNETKLILTEQIQEMTQEQLRLQELAQKEKQDGGLFGWLVELW